MSFLKISVSGMYSATALDMLWGDFDYRDKVQYIPRNMYILVGALLWCGTNEFHLAISLTYLPLDKMATILADDIFKGIFLNETDEIPIQISLTLVPRSPIDNKSTFVQVMAWHRTGNKPLPEPMMTQFIDAYMLH